VGGAIFVDQSFADITGNIIHDNHGKRPGIGITTGPSHVSHNVLYDNVGGEASWGAAIWFQGLGHRITNNTVAWNTIGISCNSGTGYVLNNIVAHCEQQGFISPNTLEVEYNNAWENGSNNLPGAYGIKEDPLFADPDNRDFTLTVGSPCIDVGDPSEPTDPDGTRSDMGAYYFTRLAGDASGDGRVSVADIVYLVNYLFKAGPAPASPELADVNASCNINTTDLVYLVGYIYRAGPAPLFGCVVSSSK